MKMTKPRRKRSQQKRREKKRRWELETNQPILVRGYSWVMLIKAPNDLDSNKEYRLILEEV